MRKYLVLILFLTQSCNNTNFYNKHEEVVIKHDKTSSDTHTAPVSPITTNGTSIPNHLAINDPVNNKLRSIDLSEKVKINGNICSKVENSKINLKGNGILVFNDGSYRRIDNYKVLNESESISNYNDFGLSTISLDEEGNGLIIWISKIGNISSQRPIQKLYMKKISKYTIENDLTILDDKINFEIQPKLYLEKNGNGFIVWKRNRDDYFYQKINDYRTKGSIEQISFNLYSEEKLIPIYSKEQLISEKFIVLNENTSLIFWIDENDSNLYVKKLDKFNSYSKKINISNKSIKTDNDYLVQINKFGDGYISFFDSNNNLNLLKTINGDVTEKFILGVISSELKVSGLNIDSNGNGLIFYTSFLVTNTNLLVKEIKEYKIVKEYKIDIENTFKEEPIIDINGLMIWSSVYRKGDACYTSYYSKIY